MRWMAGGHYILVAVQVPVPHTQNRESIEEGYVLVVWENKTIPILGERIEVKPPDNAISAAEAARTILAGVANQEGIIALPEKYRSMWHQYWSSPEGAESALREVARQRRSTFQLEGSYY